jgi:hypothetical protein
VEVTAQHDLALGGGDMLTLHYGLPIAFLNAVFSLEIDVGNQGGHRLHTVMVSKPQKEKGKED